VTAVVIEFPQLNQLEDALTELVAGNTSFMPAVQGIRYIHEQHALANIQGMNLVVWTKHVIRRSVSLQRDRELFAVWTGCAGVHVIY